MTYYITGGAGFIGSNLCDYLISINNEVVTIDNLSTGNIYNLSSVSSSPNHTFHECNLLSFDWDSNLDEGDIIIHLASTVGVEKVIQNALYTAENNSFTTKFLLDKCREFNCKLIFASTSEVYGIHNRNECIETDDLHLNIFCTGRSAYTLSKLYSEFLCLTYAKSFDVDVTVFRFFNTIGLRQNHKYGMVVPTFFYQAIHGLPLTIYGDGAQTRSFCDVRDIIRGVYLASVSNTVSGKILNIGNNEPISILELANYIKSVVNSNSEIIFLERPKERNIKIDVKHRKPNIELIKSELNWIPQYSWQEAILDLSVHYVNEYQNV